jgi:hypothetical protein
MPFYERSLEIEMNKQNKRLRERWRQQQLADQRRRFRQRPIKGGRQGLPSAVESRIWSAVEREAVRFNVSRSFVVAVALAHELGVDLDPQDDYARRFAPKGPR